MTRTASEAEDAELEEYDMELELFYLWEIPRPLG